MDLTDGTEPTHESGTEKGVHECRIIGRNARLGFVGVAFVHLGQVLQGL